MQVGSYTKLKDGRWGVRITGQHKAQSGDRVEIITKAGKQKHETIASVLWTGADRNDPTKTCSLCAIEDHDYAAGQQGSGMCENCGDYKAVTTAVDASGIEGDVCRMCARSGRMGISFA